MKLLAIMMTEEKFNQTTKEIQECKKCDLHKTRKNAVAGDGSKTADIMFIGEAPGRNEDLQGQPFVGRAGKILDKLLENIQLERNQIFIGNILKCRPPNNRNPLKSEIELCSHFLDEQIDLIKPKILVTLGSFSTNYIFEKFNIPAEKISKVHGKEFKIKDDKIIIPVYHPAVATYNPNKIYDLEKDFETIKKNLKNVD